MIVATLGVYVQRSIWPFLLIGCGVVIACASENGIGDEQSPVVVWDPGDVGLQVQRDVIGQTVPPQVDVLWVIDNSCSMSCIVGCHGAVSDKVAENFPLFMQYFEGSGLDYHIGVVTADLENTADNGQLEPAFGIRYIDTATQDPNETFFEMAAQGTTGSGWESGFGANYKALEVHGSQANAGFYREDAALHTIVLSDEDDGTQDTVITRDEFIDWYSSLKAQGVEYTYNAIVCMEPSEECTGPSQRYLSAVREIGGLEWDITRDDWALILDKLGAQAAGLSREYYLSQIPVVETIEVQVKEANGAVRTFERAEGDPPVGDWEYIEARNAISFFDYVPEAGAVVTVDYTLADQAGTFTETQ